MTMIHFNKCGVSDDKKYLMAIGMASRGEDFSLLRKINATWGKRIFQNKCPYCHREGTLIWGIHYGNGAVPCKGTPEGGSTEGHIFCKSCDKDYSCIGGHDHLETSYRVTAVSKLVKSSKGEADSLRLHGGTFDSDNLTGGADGSDKSTSSCKTYTRGFDKDKPFMAYIAIDYIISKSKDTFNENDKVHTIYLDFTADSDVEYYGFSGFETVMINNAIRVGSCNILEYIKDANMDFNGKNNYFLRRVRFLYDTPEGDNLYETDGSDDSSNKILIKSLSLKHDFVGSSKTLDTGGKTILDNFSTFIKEYDRCSLMNYGEHREDDVLSFYPKRVNKTIYTFREDDDRFVGLSNINYSPIDKTFNSSYKVFKNAGKDGKSYNNFANSRSPQSIFLYGEKEDVETLDDGTSPYEAYYKARYTNEKFTDEIKYSYTIEWEGVPPVVIGDYVECVMDNPKLSDVKQVKSISYKCSNSDACNIITTIGLDEISPIIKLYDNMRGIRKLASGKKTKYTGGAVYVSPNTPNVFYE